MKRGALELQRRKLRVDRLVERLAAVARAGGERARRPSIAPARRRRAPSRARPALLALVERGEVAAKRSRSAASSSAGHVVFAGRGPQREQPLLGPLQLARIEVGRARCACSRAARASSSALSAASSAFDARLDQLRRLRAAALQPAQRGRERRHRRSVPGDGLVRLVEVAARPSRPASCAGGARRAPPPRRGCGASFVELVDRMAQEIGLARARFSIALAVLGQRRPRRRRTCRAASATPRPRRRRPPKASSRARCVPDRPGRGRRAGRGSRRAPRRWRAAPAR